ncbi:MAG: hypothetical protein GY938_18990 [Ketobacter sp.]|nr:hypothetical protein [Ketobacter sp.]
MHWENAETDRKNMAGNHLYRLTADRALQMIADDSACGQYLESNMKRGDTYQEVRYIRGKRDCSNIYSYEEMVVDWANTKAFIERC